MSRRVGKHIKKLESVVYYIIKRHKAEEGTQKNKRESKSNNLFVQVQKIYENVFDVRKSLK